MYFVVSKGATILFEDWKVDTATGTVYMLTTRT